MGTVGKAIFLLELFTAEEPEHGLSELARKAAFDKATTRRLLVSLATGGMVEQDAESRRYRLGAGLSRLARIREMHFPFLKVTVPVARGLAQETGETIHVSEYSAGALATVHVELSARANRVNVDVGQLLPLHGTASGIAFLAFSRPTVMEACMRRAMAAFTPYTVTAPDALMTAVQAAAARGYSRSDQGYEEGVSSVAAPILGVDGCAIGTLAIASPLSRIDDTIAEAHGRAAIDAAREISARLSGEPVAAALERAS
ncbi:IclR family transcriptional regulator [Nitratireductor soli]|uniref:IclR family transcriptional regulator n=1 Tax=Nitratireductor soli TaxID=1670619 RepID=UPI00065E4377|nr:IclR family transcriptional regulator [Nitratireductor soli]